jgi:hypothetical protein
MQQQAQLQQQAQMQFSAFQFAQPLPQAAFQPAPVAYATQGVPMATQGYATPCYIPQGYAPQGHSVVLN